MNLIKFSDYVAIRNEGKITNVAKKALFAGVALASIGHAQSQEPAPRSAPRPTFPSIEQRKAESERRLEKLAKKHPSELTDEEKKQLGYKFLSKKKKESIEKQLMKQHEENAARRREAAEEVRKKKEKELNSKK